MVVIYQKSKKKGKVTKWVKDKKGILFGKFIVDKLLNSVREYLAEKIMANHKKIQNEIEKGGKYEKLSIISLLMGKIRDQMGTSKFKQDIIKKSGSHFAFDRNKYEQEILLLK